MTDNQELFTSITNFIPIQKLGEGSFSTVYKVKRVADNQIYALKKVKIATLKQKEKQNALNQVRILASINSPYIISYKQAFFDDSLNILCIVMELASNNIPIQKDKGDLFQKIQFSKKRFNYLPQRQIWKAIYHITMGLEVLHSKNILHRDLKTANIFLSNGYYKLGDLNVSKVQQDGVKLAYTQTGTPYYASPEIWKDQPYDFKSDVWSFGCLIYQMCTFRTPFRGKNMDQLFKNVMNGMYEDIPEIYSKELRRLINMCLRKNPKDRPSIRQLLSERGIIAEQCINQNIALDFRSSYKYDQQDDILKTIKLPGNLKMLKKKLPKSKYDNDNSDSDIRKKYSFMQRRQQSQGKVRKKVISSMEVNSLPKDNMEDNENKKKQQCQPIKYLLKQSQSQKNQKDKNKMRCIRGIKIVKSITQNQPKEQKQFQKQLNTNSCKQLKSIQEQTKQLYDKITSMNFLKNIKSQKCIPNTIINSHNRQTAKNQPTLILDNNNKDYQYLDDISKKITEKKSQKYKIGLIRQPSITNNMRKQFNKESFQILQNNQDKQRLQDKKLLISKQHIEMYYNYQNAKSKIRINNINLKINKANSTPYMLNIAQIPKNKKLFNNLNSKQQIFQLKKKLTKNLNTKQKNYFEK